MKQARRWIWTLTAALALSGGASAQRMMGDGDAKVSKADFLKHAEERFARMDANKDGVIDASDRQKMRERLRECRDMMEGMGMMHGPRKMGGGTSGSKEHEAQHPKP